MNLATSPNTFKLHTLFATLSVLKIVSPKGHDWTSPSFSKVFTASIIAIILLHSWYSLQSNDIITPWFWRHIATYSLWTCQSYVYVALERYYSLGISPATQRSCKEGLKQSINFCLQAHLPTIPPLKCTLLLFVTHLAYWS